MRLALIVEYEGTNYHGFQYQPNVPSIQEELEKAIERFTGEKVRVQAAGRTDTGVHAKGQVVAFDTKAAHPHYTFVQALNYHLPEDVAVKAACRVGQGFDPRRGALSRRYRYTILNSRSPSPLWRRTSYRVTEPLDVRKMQEAAKLLIGTHDFASFSGPLEERRRGTIRDVYRASVSRKGELVHFDVEANAFLPHQVRRMTGPLVEIGRGRLSLDDFRDMINGSSSRATAHSLPARGLCLMQVTYADFPPEAGESDGNER